MGPIAVAHAVGPLNLELFKSVAEQLMAGKTVMLEHRTFEVQRTSSQRLRTVRFSVEGREYQAIEQNAQKPSRWGQLARAGHQVVQFRDLQTGRYVAVAVDGDVKEYGRRGDWS